MLQNYGNAINVIISKSGLPFSHLGDHSWLIFNELKKKQTSEDVDILSAKDIDFATECDL